jgi:pheromone shutdown protein TraB
MIDEIGQLQDLGQQVVAVVGPGSRTGVALAALRAADSASLHLHDVSHRYSLASEILACAVEELPTESSLQAAAQDALDTRLEREMSIIGEFQLVGRS